VLGKLRQPVPVKVFFFFGRFRTLQCLSKYFFLYRKDNDILEIDFENKYVTKNEDCESGVWRIHGVFIAHKFLYREREKGETKVQFYPNSFIKEKYP